MPDNLFAVAGQVVVVSGASRGIGKAAKEKQKEKIDVFVDILPD